ncbi:dynamin family protein [Chlorobaculum sp. MV4-Y]|uniref:dynamin family protein n=1 Tax=Chlorobaculum sp. MV4-Y TaxID=2976335 RepID=UPI0021AFCDED|nr:dynamin family protein [Chlorobaculum sp. MV4-Y]UWX57882.1 dynamin family protein [Chlorobaculum sp. MV4-Y]
MAKLLFLKIPLNATDKALSAMVGKYAELIREVTEINDAIGAPKTTRSVERLLEEEDGFIYVAALGQFKSGKSSLINSLIGEPLLPVGVVPLTSIVTCVKYGPVPKVTIQFTSGEGLETSLQELPKYVTEKQNPDNVHKVSLAIVEHPALADYRKVALVDTPGLGSLYRHNTDETLQWMPHAGVAMVSVSAERPLGDDDLLLLKGIVRYCPFIYFVITKTDLFKDAEIEEIKTHISSAVNKLMGDNVPVLLYSVNQDEARHRTEVMKQAIKPLHDNFAAKYDQIVRRKLLTVIEESVGYNEVALQAALIQNQNKEVIKGLLDEIKDNRSYYEQEMRLFASNFKSLARTKLEAIVLPFAAGIRAEVLSAFTREYASWPGTLAEISQQYEQWLKNRMRAEIAKVNEEVYTRIEALIHEMLRHFEYAARQFRVRLEEKVFELLGVQLPEKSWQLDFAGIEKPDIAVYRAFDTHLDMFIFFLPMSLFRWLFLKHFQNKIPREVEKNLERYISSVNLKIFKLIDNMHRQVSSYVGNEIANLERVLQRDASGLKHLTDNKSRLEEMSRLLAESRSERD